MSLARAITQQPTGNMLNVTDAGGNSIQVPEYVSVADGEWQYTDANGNTSVIADASAIQADAEAARDAWLAAGATP